MKNLIIIILVAVQLGLTMQIIRVQRSTEVAKQEELLASSIVTH